MIMEIQTRSCLFILGVVLLSQNLVFCASNNNLEDQKNIYIPPFPYFGSPPFVLTPPIDPSTPIVPSPPIVYSSPPPVYGGGTPPSRGSGGGTPPSRGSGGTPPTYGGGTPPSRGSGGGTPPSRGSGGGTPPSRGSGGSTPSPVRRTPPTPSHGGGSGGRQHGRRSPPPTNCGSPPKLRSPPKRAPVDPSPPVRRNPSPAPPTYQYSPPSTGTTPPIVLPPITPTLPFPSPPADPNSPPIGGPCDFWRNHPTIIWGLFGWYGPTIGTAFGIGALPGGAGALPGGAGALPGAGASLNLIQALSNTRTDGFGALYREGTASLLNSMVNKHFPYTTSHVKNSFLAASGSNKAAAAQARVFKLANEGHMKLRV